MDIPIVFEDKAFLVIDKPWGVVVNRAETTKTETIQDWMEEKYAVSSIAYPVSMENTEEFKTRSGIVHRLDKDTSGLLVIAKTPAAFENLKNQFKERTTVKKYVALAHGKVEPPSGEINAPIERNPFNRMHFGVFPGGREALTNFKVLKFLKALKQDYSFLEVTPKTGRTHQIRVHLKYLNHPIVSDPIYGGRKNYQHDLKFCPRLFLHAKYLKIKHPVTAETMEFESRLPRELEDVLNSIS